MDALVTALYCFSRFRLRRRLDVGGDLPREVLRHLQTPEIAPVADPIPRLQDDRLRVAGKFVLERTSLDRIFLEGDEEG